MTDKDKAEKGVKEGKEEEDQQIAYNDVVTLLEWHAPGRPFKKHSAEYFINLFLIVTAIEIIVFLFHIYLLMLVVLAVGFLAFGMALVPPHTFYYKITTEGIRVEDYFYIWEELYDFYFAKEKGIDVLRIGTKAYIPGELTILLGDIPKQDVKEALILFLPYREYVSRTFTQKAGDWLGKNFPLEKSAN